MKKFTSILKVRPEDFRVEEVLDLPTLSSDGRYSYYKLEKRNINTFLVIDLIQKLWKIPRSKIGFCGLKDKRAVTTQYISIENGPKENLVTDNFSLTYLGRADKPLSLGEAEGNFFTITLRSVDPETILKRLNILKRIGFANYFGEQRFAPDLYLKRPLIKIFLEKGLEEGLKAYFCQHPKKSSLLKRYWDDWEKFFKVATHLSSLERRVLKIYIDKKNAEKAFRAFPKHLKLLFLFSYQSLLWNRVLANFLKKYSLYYEVDFVKGEKLVFHRELNPILQKLKNFEIPFISKDIFNWDGPEELRREIFKIIARENLQELLDKELTGLKLFVPGKRRMIVFPEDLGVIQTSRREFVLKFFLPSGSYATIFLLKLLTYPI